MLHIPDKPKQSLGFNLIKEEEKKSINYDSKCTSEDDLNDKSFEIS